MTDPYEILGVQKTDSDAAIRSAYRKLAKTPPSRRQPRQAGGGGAVQGDQRRLRPAGRQGQARALRPRRDRRLRQRGAAAAAVLPRLRRCRRAREIPLPMPAFNHDDLEGIFARPSAAGRRRARTAVLDARPGRPLPAHARLPRCGQRHHAPRHAAGRTDAGCAHPGGRARRPGHPAEGPGHAGDRRRRAGRCAGGGLGRAASGVPPRGRRHHR